VNYNIAAPDHNTVVLYRKGEERLQPLQQEMKSGLPVQGNKKGRAIAGSA